MLTSVLQKKVGVSPETYYKARKYLENLDLVEKYSLNLGKIKPFRLTEKGKKIGEILKKTEEVILELV